MLRPRKEVQPEIERLLSLPDDEMAIELRKKTNPELAELGHHSKKLCDRMLAYNTKEK